MFGSHVEFDVPQYHNGPLLRPGYVANQANASVYMTEER
jgi:hypothetical protein